MPTALTKQLLSPSNHQLMEAKLKSTRCKRITRTHDVFYEEPNPAFKLLQCL